MSAGGAQKEARDAPTTARPEAQDIVSSYASYLFMHLAQSATVLTLLVCMPVCTVSESMHISIFYSLLIHAGHVTDNTMLSIQHGFFTLFYEYVLRALACQTLTHACAL